MEDVAAFDPALAAAAEQLAAAGIAVSECVDGLRSLAERLEFDPDEFRRLQERLDLLVTLETRYGMSCDALIEQSVRWREELDSIHVEDDDRVALVAARDAAAKETGAAARELTKSRRRAAQALDRGMTGAMEGLMMRGAAFRTTVEHVEDPRSRVRVERAAVALFEDGVDVVRFRVRTNPGEEEGPIERVASTGEISRIALALKELTSDGRAGSVLIFDEIDAGIGADLGSLVGQKLLALSLRYQIICITHMPQVAARAHHHLAVIKESDDERASVRIETLEGSGRRSEIARMLGGAEGSDRRRALAEELLQSGGDESRQARP
jgi:DNA repair protein RecN (Recombination protein N)